MSGEAAGLRPASGCPPTQPDTPDPDIKFLQDNKPTCLSRGGGAHLPNLTHRSPLTSCLHKYLQGNKSICLLRTLSIFQSTSGWIFFKGYLPTFAPFASIVELTLLATPPSSRNQKSTGSRSRQKAYTSFPARYFLLQGDNKGCQYALNEAQSCPVSNPEKKL